MAKDGKEALKKFEKESPQVVVLDIRMSVMGGIEALNAMLGKNRQISVVLSTAYSQYRENFMTWGVEDYVIKSPDLRERKQKIQKVLDKWKMSHREYQSAN